MAATLDDTLGVSKSASPDEIKKAYRKLARKHHPDANAGDPTAEERFKEVQHAYDVLSDPEKRKAYDRGPRPFGPGSSNGGDFEFDLGDLGDIFGGLFGGGRGGRGAPRQPARGGGVAGARAQHPHRETAQQLDPPSRPGGSLDQGERFREGIVCPLAGDCLTLHAHSLLLLPETPTSAGICDGVGHVTIPRKPPPQPERGRWPRGE